MGWVRRRIERYLEVKFEEGIGDLIKTAGSCNFVQWEFKLIKVQLLVRLSIWAQK